jgi:hypothetical protein
MSRRKTSRAKRSGQLGSMPATHRAKAAQFSAGVDALVREAKAQANHGQCPAALNTLMSARLFQGKAEAHTLSAGDQVDVDRLERTVDAMRVFQRKCMVHR